MLEPFCGEKLSNKEALVLKLKYFNGERRTNTKVGKITGIDPNLVRYYLQKALEKLRIDTLRWDSTAKLNYVLGNSDLYEDLFE